MEIPEWYFGPAGDLRPLPAPGMDVVNTVERFGGIHNAINGARTVDVLGHRASYEFELPYLTPEEFYWIEALYTETIPGPFYLLDPLRKNRFSRETATARPADASGRGLISGNRSTLKWQLFHDSPVDWIKRGVRWTNLTESEGNGANLELDNTPFIPVLPHTGVVVSVYARANEPVGIRIRSDYMDAAGNVVPDSGADDYTDLSGSWTRVTRTLADFPANTVTVRPELWTEVGSATADTAIELIGFQAEHGYSATELALGGGSGQVVIDTMETTSPYYPLQTVNLSILEV